MQVVWDGQEDIVKMVILGECGVGKSSLALRFVSNAFQHYTESTIGANYLSKTVEVDTRKITFKIWDTAGQEKYNSLVPMYYRGAGAAILVFDISRPETIASLERWVEELKANGPPDIIIALCGNKADLEKDRRISKERANQYAEEIGAVYTEVSARDDINVVGLFDEIAQRVVAIQNASGVGCNGLMDAIIMDGGCKAEDKSGNCC